MKPVNKTNRTRTQASCSSFLPYDRRTVTYTTTLVAPGGILLGREQHVDIAARDVHIRQRSARALVGGVGRAGRVPRLGRRRRTQAAPERVVPGWRRRRRPLRRGALRRRAEGRQLRPLLRAGLARRREVDGRGLVVGVRPRWWRWRWLRRGGGGVSRMWLSGGVGRVRRL